MTDNTQSLLDRMARFIKIIVDKKGYLDGAQLLADYEAHKASKVDAVPVAWQAYLPKFSNYDGTLGAWRFFSAEKANEYRSIDGYETRALGVIDQGVG